MVDADPPKIGIPADVREHVEYPRPREFSGVEWRDFAELRDRVGKLEGRNDRNDRESSKRSEWIKIVVAAVLGGLITLAIPYLQSVLAGSPTSQQNRSDPSGQRPD